MYLKLMGFTLKSMEDIMVARNLVCRGLYAVFNWTSPNRHGPTHMKRQTSCRIEGFLNPVKIQGKKIMSVPPSDSELQVFAEKLRQEHRFLRQRLNDVHCCIQELVRITSYDVRNIPSSASAAEFETYGKTSGLSDFLKQLTYELKNIIIDTEQSRYLLDVYRQLSRPESNYRLNETHLGTFVDLISEYEQNCKLKENLENLINTVHKKIVKLEQKQKTVTGASPNCLSELAAEWCGRGIPNRSDQKQPDFRFSPDNETSSALSDIHPRNDSSNRDSSKATIAGIDTENGLSTRIGLQVSKANSESLYKLSPRSKGKRASSLSRVRSPVLASILKKDPVCRCIIDERMPLTDISNK